MYIGCFHFTNESYPQYLIITLQCKNGGDSAESLFKALSKRLRLAFFHD